MTLTTATPLTKRLSNNWVVEVNTGDDVTPVWTRVNGMNKVALTIDGNAVDVTDFDSAGWEGSLTTTRKWTLAVEGFDGYTGPDNAPVADPGQAALKSRGLLTGAAAQIGVRFYRPDSTNSGYSGRATCNYKSAGGGAKDVEPFSCELAGDGALAAITAE